MSKVISIIFLLAFFFVGPIVFIIGMKAEEQAKASRRWPHVKGEITYSDVSVSRSSDSDCYTPDVKYKYMVDGKTFEADVIAIGAQECDSSTANRKSNQYPKGQAVEVRYNSENPNEACLKPGDRGQNDFTQIFGVLWSLAMIFAVVFFYRHKKQKENYQLSQDDL